MCNPDTNSKWLDRRKLIKHDTLHTYITPVTIDMYVWWYKCNKYISHPHKVNRIHTWELYKEDGSNFFPTDKTTRSHHNNHSSHSHCNEKCGTKGSSCLFEVLYSKSLTPPCITLLVSSYYDFNAMTSSYYFSTTLI